MVAQQVSTFSRDDAHPDRAFSTFRIDRWEICSFVDVATGLAVSLD
jgi:hypothetical protein